ncbi:hypothetical protein [Cellulomonas timonensis]|uniref:hypothetical protein n=1 Tax=Cellulomonas timonensis TaxID=1689271 RepID=UPI0011CC1CEC|nr:hypothetical protein [Cellulomonas timonensis]
MSGAVLAMGLAACSPAEETGGQTDSGSFEMSINEWREDFDDCMNDAGFDLTQGAEEGGSVPSVDISQFDVAELDLAYAACVEEVGDAPVDDTLPTEEEVFESQLVFASCMREAGIDFPDPVKGSGMTSAFSSDVDPEIVDACSAEANAQDSSR